MKANWIDLSWLFFCVVVFAVLFCGCQTPRSSYTNGVIVLMSTTKLAFGWGEYIEVAPGGKVHRKITGEKDKLELIIDNGAVKGAGEGEEVKVKGENHDEN